MRSESLEIAAQFTYRVWPSKVAKQLPLSSHIFTNLSKLDDTKYAPLVLYLRKSNKHRLNNKINEQNGHLKVKITGKVKFQQPDTRNGWQVAIETIPELNPHFMSCTTRPFSFRGCSGPDGPYFNFFAVATSRQSIVFYKRVVFWNILWNWGRFWGWNYRRPWWSCWYRCSTPPGRGRCRNELLGCKPLLRWCPRGLARTTPGWLPVSTHLPSIGSRGWRPATG